MAGTPNEVSTPEGFEFDALRRAENYRTTLLAEFRHFLKGHVLEIGAGIGQITCALSRLPGIEKLLAVEPEARFCQSFRRLHPRLTVLEGTLETVQIEPDWDAIVCVNVLEHIREDEAELGRFRQKLAARRGHLCLFVPARQEIYAPIDRDFGHYRRYARPELSQKLRRAGFSVLRLHYFNFIGYFAWWLCFCLLQNRQFDVDSVTFFDRFVLPWSSALERTVLRPPLGQSVIAVARAG